MAVQQLTPEVLAQLNTYAQNGDAASYYSTLSLYGHEYANLAYEAATNTGFASIYANNFMANKAAEYSVSLDRNKIMQELMQADYDARLAKDGWPATAENIRDYHQTVFELNNLPRAAWTGSFLDARLGPAAWCLSCNSWELQGATLTDAVFNLVKNLATDWNGTSSELSGFVDDALNDGVFSETLADMDLQAGWGIEVAAATKAITQTLAVVTEAAFSMPGLILEGWGYIFSPIYSLFTSAYSLFTSDTGSTAITESDPVSGQMVQGIVFTPSASNTSVVVTRLNNAFEATETYELYTVQSGDVLSQIAQEKGVAQSLIEAANSQITDPNLIFAGEQIKIPRVISDGNASQAPSGTTLGPDQFYIDDTFDYDAQVVAWFTGVSESALLAANPGLDFNNLSPGQIVNLPSVNNSFLNITIDTNPQPTLPETTDETFGAGDIFSGYLERDSTSSVWMPDNFVNGGGWMDRTPSAITIDDWRPGEGQILSDTLDTLFNPPPVQDFGYTSSWLGGAGLLNNVSQQALNSIYVDPLVLDLNGDGVKLTDYTNDPVLFDISEYFNGYLSQSRHRTATMPC